MSKLVRIQSTKTISVTPGLYYKDVTNPDAHVPDRLKISAEWPKASLMIYEGVREYPAEIVNWPTVKSLIADKILTVGEVSEAMGESQKLVEEFERKMESVEGLKKTSKKSKKLDEIAE